MVFMSMDTAQLCTLSDTLGAKPVAYVAGVNTTSEVLAWVETHRQLCTLRDVLGAKLVAYVAGVNTTSEVRAWIEDRRQPTDLASARLAVVAEALRWANRDSAQVFQAWMMGMNPLFDDDAPATMICHATTDEQLADVRERVVHAAYVQLAHD